MKRRAPIINRKRKRPTLKKSAAKKKADKAHDAIALEARRAKAYEEMENSVCEIVRMGELAMNCFDDPDRGLFIFAVDHLDWMLHRFRDRYYAAEFPLSD